MRPLFVGWHPLERRLAVSFSILSLGTGLSLSVLAVYLVRQLHAGPATYGVAMSVAALCGMVSGPVAGRLADRADTRRTYASLVWTMAVATGMLAVADEWAAFALVCLLMTCGRGSAAVLGALVGREVPAERRVRYRAVVKTLSNAAMFMGLGLGAVVLSIDSRSLFRASFVVEALTLCVAGALVGTSPSRGTASAGASDGQGAQKETRPKRRQGRGVRHNPWFLGLSAVNACVMLYSSLLTVGLPLWIAAQAPSLLWLVSVVTAINLAAVLLLQLPASNKINDARAAVRAGARGALLLAAGVLMFPLAEAVDGHAAKAALLIVLGLLVAGGEVLYSASSWELVYALAPSESLGEYQGVFNLGLDVSMLVAPALLAWLAGGRHALGWFAVAGGFGACALLIRPIAGRAGAATATAQSGIDRVGASS
jgi:hypothetical protein